MVVRQQRWQRRRQRAQSLLKNGLVQVWVQVLGYMVVWTLGVIGGVLFWLLVLCGRIRIQGYWRAVGEVWRGRLIIAANHPSLGEPALIALMFFPWYLIAPWRFFVWSVPDRRLVTPALRWLFTLGRCIAVDRSARRHNRAASRDIPAVLATGGVVVIHPEAGRTSTEALGRPIIEWGNRQLRTLRSGAPSLALRAGARILPLWVAGAQAVFPRAGFPLRFDREVVTFSFGRAYQPTPGRTPCDYNRELEDKLFRA